MTFKTCVTTLCVGVVLLAADQPLDKAVLDRWMQELSNWGRWGKDDQLGTVNLITPAKRKAAADEAAAREAEEEAERQAKKAAREAARAASEEEAEAAKKKRSRRKQTDDN